MALTTINTVTYSVNGKPITFEELKTLQITKKDYIAYMEDIKKKLNIKIINE